MRELGVWDRCRYPGFSADPMSGFDNLAHDLVFADDFLVGSGEILQQAAVKEAAVSAARQADLRAGYVGDKRKIERMHECFREKRYADVAELARDLEYPGLLSESERKMIEVAQRRAGVS